MKNKTLIAISKEMQTQDNRATAYPLFVVMVDKKVYGCESWCNEVERKEDFDSDYLCEKCAEKYENNEDLDDYCEDCDQDCFVWFSWEKDFDLKAGVFFTAKACDEHIRLNDYHYSNPRSYAISAWRNYEMQEVINFLIKYHKNTNEN